jgi:microsomal dipeptidase-like Zn-dependent dipeptidase
MSFQYADIHCHPNLKTFGHSFMGKTQKRSSLWYERPSTRITRWLHKKTGITKFSQGNLSLLSKAHAKVVFVSLYPFEKGFFHHPLIPNWLAAHIGNWGIEIGYHRIRYVQQHLDYFKDLCDEYDFICNHALKHEIDGKKFEWELTNGWDDIEQVLATPNHTAIIFSIEGAHVFNSGLGHYGRAPNEAEILSNIQKLKKWKYPVIFIGLGHNFNNDLCGHARSLERLGSLVNQEVNLNMGISALGKKVITALLDNTNGRRIYIDLKHMSLKSRQEYYAFLFENYREEAVPLIVSHGGVAGRPIEREKQTSDHQHFFNDGDINFFDEELIAIASSGGLFGLQMDQGILSDVKKVKKHKKLRKQKHSLQGAAQLVWNQLSYVAVLLDSHGLPAWQTCCLGTDFDGSINPFTAVPDATGLEGLAEEMTLLADAFLKDYSWKLKVNGGVSGKEVIEKWCMGNIIHFLENHY